MLWIQWQIQPFYKLNAIYLHKKQYLGSLDKSLPAYSALDQHKFKNCCMI